MKTLEVIDLINKFNGPWEVYAPVYDDAGKVIDCDRVATHRSPHRAKDDVMHKTVHDFSAAGDSLRIYVGVCQPNDTFSDSTPETSPRREDLPNTCVYMNCPFISICKDYNLFADRGDSCETQKRIIRAAEALIDKK